MEVISSYLSVVGLSALFSGDIVIIVMAVILDIAKVTSVSFLYQYWGEIKRAMKYYLTAAVVVLMLITSAGAFGYLSAAFQRAIQPNLEVSLRVDSLSRQQTSLETEKKELTDLKLSINKQIASVPTSETDVARRRLIASMKPELDRTNKRLETVNTQLDDIRTKTLAAKSENLDKDVHAGPIVYVSKAFGLSMEDASKYIILIIVAVFDPLAIMLVLAANFLIKRRNEVVPPTDPAPPPPPLVQEPTAEIPPEVKLQPVVKEEVPFTAEDLIQHISPEPTPEPLPPEPALTVVEEIEPVDVAVETKYSGSPQAEHIQPLPVVLEKQGMVLK